MQQNFYSEKTLNYFNPDGNYFTFKCQLDLNQSIKEAHLLKMSLQQIQVIFQAERISQVQFQFLQYDDCCSSLCSMIEK